MALTDLFLLVLLFSEGRDEPKVAAPWRRDERERDGPPPGREEERDQERDWRRGGDSRDDRFRDDRSRDDRFRDERPRDDRFRDERPRDDRPRDDRFRDSGPGLFKKSKYVCCHVRLVLTLLLHWQEYRLLKSGKLSAVFSHEGMSGNRWVNVLSSISLLS